MGESALVFKYGQTLVTNSCSYCNFFTRGDSIGAGESALVFKHGQTLVTT